MGGRGKRQWDDVWEGAEALALMPCCVGECGRAERPSNGVWERRMGHWRQWCWWLMVGKGKALIGGGQGARERHQRRRARLWERRSRGFTRRQGRDVLEWKGDTCHVSLTTFPNLGGV